MTKKEMWLAGELLSLAADEFGNHGCNDLDQSLLRDFTPEERADFAKTFSEWNGDSENERSMEQLSDSVIMAFLAARLKVASIP